MSIEHIVSKVLDAAAGGVDVQSTGEKLMAALVLNRPDWLAQWDYTIAEAIDRVGAEWAAEIPRVAKLVDQAQAREADANAVARQAMALAKAKGAKDVDRDEIDCTATLVTYGSAPGYRDASLTFDLQPLGDVSGPFRVSMRIRPDDAEPIVRHLHHVHELAWRRSAPLDAQLGENRPAWIDRVALS
jgi:hypothetical protein